MPSLISTLLCSVISFLFSIGCCYFALFSISFRRGLRDSASYHKSQISECENIVPFQYLVPHSYLHPVVSRIPTQFDTISTGTVYLFESSYRNQGFIDQHLKMSDLLDFSRSIYVGALLTIHNISFSDLKSDFGRVLPNGLILGHPLSVQNYSIEIDWFNKSFYPSQFEVNMSQFDFAQSKPQNPLEFRIQSVKSINGISSIKRALVVSNRPFAVAFRVPQDPYFTECENVSSCGHSFQCPFDHSLWCERSFYPPPEALQFDRIGRVFGAPVVMSIVGFNDNYISAFSNEKGAFIIRSGVGAFGHSYEYLLNEISEKQEAEICHPIPSPLDWIPVSGIEALNSTNFTQLSCVDHHKCDPQKKYALIGEKTAKIKKSRFGFDYATVVEYYNSSEYILREILVPFEYLFWVLRPVNWTAPFSSYCGYAAVPYSEVEEIMRYSTPGFSFSAVDMAIKWTEASYLSSGFVRNYTALQNSMRTFKNLTRGLPFDPVGI